MDQGVNEKNENYLSNSKIIRYKTFKIEVIPNTKNNLKDKRDKVLNDLREICKQAGQDPEDHVVNYFNLADLLMVIRENNKLCGFVVAHYAEINVVHIPATMIIPSCQKMGLATFINTFVIKRFFLERIKKSKYKIWNYLRPLYLIFRTQNPIIYTSLDKGIVLFPSITKKQNPTSREIALAKKYAEKFWPDCNFDPNNFILIGAYFNHPRLMLDPKNISWSKDDKVNEYFEQKLGLTTRGGHALLVMGKIRFLDVLKSVAKLR